MGEMRTIWQHAQDNEALTLKIALRDSLAAAALTGLLSQGSDDFPRVGNGAMDAARDAYWYADAMMEARKY